MRVRALTANNDYSFGHSQNDFLANSPAAVAQIIKTSLDLFLGEWYLDQTVGMPWLQGVIGKYTQATADQTVESYIQDIQNVVNIASYESIDNQGNREYSATAVVNTDFGTTEPIQIQQEL